MGIFGSIIGGIGGALLAPFTGGASIPIGAGIGDSIENSRDAKKANAQKMGLYNDQMALAQQQFQFQQDYAKNRLQWQVEDAKKAGLHPMVAAGLSPTSFSPVSTPSFPDLSSVASDLGQNLDYAVTKAKTQKQQAEALAFMRESNMLELEGKHLDNELKQMEIMSMLSRLTNSGPSAPEVNTNASQPDIAIPAGGYAGAVPLFTLARHGRVFLDSVNPDIADSITESALAHARAMIQGEFQAQKGYVLPPLQYLDKSERAALERGDIEVVRIPGGWEIRDSLKKKARDTMDRYNSRKHGPSWSHPQNWKWLNEAGAKLKGWFDSF